MTEESGQAGRGTGGQDTGGHRAQDAPLPGDAALMDCPSAADTPPPPDTAPATDTAPPADVPSPVHGAAQQDAGAGGVLLLSRQGAVAVVTMNRPDRGNGLTTELKTALRDTLNDLAADSGVRAVVLTGAGRSFCVGQDLAEHAAALRADPATALDTVREHYNPITLTLATMPKPVVAAVNGTCVGAGLGFALACDLRVVADTARFGTAFTGVGLSCDSGLSATLARAVGGARASELVLLGELFTAEQAAAWGIAGKVVPAAEVLGAAVGLAARLAEGPTLAYAEAKRALAAAWNPAETLSGEAEAQYRLGLTADHRNAVDSFLTKQPPRFTGR